MSNTIKRAKATDGNVHKFRVHVYIVLIHIFTGFISALTANLNSCTETAEDGETQDKPRHWVNDYVLI